MEKRKKLFFGLNLESVAFHIIGGVITIIIMLMSFAYFFGQQTEKITINTKSIERIEENIKEIDNRLSTSIENIRQETIKNGLEIREIKTDVKNINRNIERLIESSNQNKKTYTKVEKQLF